MLKRRLGRTNHESSVAILGGFALGNATPDEAGQILHAALDAGVNHIDIAPSYMAAEDRLGPHLPPVRDRVFLACKTTERSADAARAELERSLEKLRTDHFELYQLHAVVDRENLDACLAPGGSVEALLRARDEGLVKHLGVTGHFQHVPHLFYELLQQVDFDTVMLPVNASMWALPDYRAGLERLFALCAERDLGVMAIKAIARGPWRDDHHEYQTWYQPLDDQAAIDEAVRFALSLPIHAFATAGEPRLLAKILSAAERFTPMSPEAIEAMAAATRTEALLAPA